MPGKLELLRKVPLLADLPEAQLGDLASYLKEKHFRRGEYIIYEGDEGNELFIIIEGLVKITKLNEDGREKILATLGEGEFFGELALVDGAPRSATVQAKSACIMYSLARNEFLNLLRQAPEVCLSIITVLARRLREANIQIEDMTFKDARSKLVSLLLELASKYGGPTAASDKVRLQHKFTHQELADMISSSRETVSRLMGNLLEEGFIEMDSDHHLLIKKPKGK
jgi:CRP/FNR family transcriptional regulator, cyclic AMP receptor protein